MTFDRFDIVTAWYHYLTESHGGMGSREYRRLSRLLGYFKPGASDAPMSENAREIYTSLRLAGMPDDVRESILDEMSGEDIEDVSAWLDAAIRAHA